MRLEPLGLHGTVMTDDGRSTSWSASSVSWKAPTGRCAGRVYCVGMPGSLNTVVQFLGRAMRLKADDYPALHRDRARLVFFVPCGGGTAPADLSIDHSRHALLTCCFVADHEVGQE